MSMSGAVTFSHAFFWESRLAAESGKSAYSNARIIPDSIIKTVYGTAVACSSLIMTAPQTREYTTKNAYWDTVELDPPMLLAVTKAIR